MTKAEKLLNLIEKVDRVTIDDIVDDLKDYGYEDFTGKKISRKNTNTFGMVKVVPKDTIEVYMTFLDNDAASHKKLWMV